MIGNTYQSVFIKSSELAQTAVNIAAERGARFVRVNRAADPALHKNRRDAVADLEFRDRFARFDDFARAVGKRHERTFEFRIIKTFDHHQIAVVQRCGVKFHFHFRFLRQWFVAFGERQIVYPELVYLVNFHNFLYFIACERREKCEKENRNISAFLRALSRANSYLSTRCFQIEPKHDIITNQIVGFSGVKNLKIFAVDRKFAFDFKRFY